MQATVFNQVRRTGNWAVFLLALLALLLPVNGFAQVGGAGNIQGTVTDTSGAQVQGASVTVTNTDTSISQKVTTGATGFYNALNLPVSTYSVRVEKPGFQVGVTESISVTRTGSADRPGVLESGPRNPRSRERCPPAE